MMDKEDQKHLNNKVRSQNFLRSFVESWRLQVVGSLIAGVVAGLLASFIPKNYESTAILRLTEKDVFALRASPALDVLMEVAHGDGAKNAAHQVSKKKLQYKVDKKTKLLIITANGETPFDAQFLGSAALTVVLTELEAKDKEKILLQKIIAHNQRVIDESVSSTEYLRQSLVDAEVSERVKLLTVDSLTAITSDIVKRTKENKLLINRLESKGVEMVLQQPTLPRSETSPAPISVGLLVAIVTGFIVTLLTIFVKSSKALNKTKSQ